MIDCFEFSTRRSPSTWYGTRQVCYAFCHHRNATTSFWREQRMRLRCCLFIEVSRKFEKVSTILSRKRLRVKVLARVIDFSSTSVDQ
jgi:hypothetical protein